MVIYFYRSNNSIKMGRYSSVCISIINFINLIIFKGSKSPLTKTSDASCISVLTLTFCPDSRHELRSVLGRLSTPS